ncbi:MAG TPA: GTPase [Candidatus Azoamicus sp. MARI]
MKIISIIGKTNTGKSTLFNKLIEKKESIISKKKNTTIRCVEKKINNAIIIDTPGLTLNNKINIKTANNLIYDSIKKSDIVIINIEELNIESEDLFLLDINKNKNKILTINKIDKITIKKNLLNLIKNLSDYSNFIEIIPLSNIKNINIKKTKDIIDNIRIDKTIEKHLYKKETLDLKITDIIRETFLDLLNKEIPYNITINIEEHINKYIKELNININIKKYNYKKIIIGTNGKNIIQIKNTIKNKINNIYKLRLKQINIHIKYDNKYRNRHN